MCDTVGPAVTAVAPSPKFHAYCVIDAPDCGTTIGAFTDIGRDLINHDAQRNLLLSVHAYWAGYDGTPDIQTAVASSTLLPIVFGEIANKQSEGDDECYYGLDGSGLNHAPPTGFTYKTLLPPLGEYDIGWLAWCWWPSTTGWAADCMRLRRARARL